MTFRTVVHPCTKSNSLTLILVCFVKLMPLYYYLINHFLLSRLSVVFMPDSLFISSSCGQVSFQELISELITWYITIVFVLHSFWASLVQVFSIASDILIYFPFVLVLGSLVAIGRNHIRNFLALPVCGFQLIGVVESDVIGRSLFIEENTARYRCQGLEMVGACVDE